MIKLLDLLNESIIDITQSEFATNTDVSELKNELRIDSNEFWKRFDQVVKTLNKLPNPIPVYRAVRGEKVDVKNLGNHWTFDKKEARQYVTGPSNSQAAELTILQGLVDKQHIDQVATITYNLLIPMEKEIYIKDPSKVKLL